MTAAQHQISLLHRAGITSHKNFKKNYTMAFTPSKDQRRRDREQKKKDKIFARETAKVELLAAQKVAEEEAAAAAIKKSKADAIAKEEADFEAELAAEAAAKV
ncbi:MAG: plasmid replication initiation protein [Lentimonas sp.]|jgi:plasmid replication initiation protein